MYYVVFVRAPELKIQERELSFPRERGVSLYRKDL